jgi:hypothetical protein
MIHFITVHHQTDIWIDIQLRYLRRHVSGPYLVHAAFTGVDPEPHRGKFSTAISVDTLEHFVKLDLVATSVMERAAPDDVIAFIDSDAFPIAPISYLLQQLDEWPLIAVRRDENLGDPQPHPSFCITTARVWRDVEGDWGNHHGWLNDAGERVHDTGGNLLNTLRERSVAWKPLLRSNEIDLHPVLFGIYDGSIYHHGAGSRLAVTRAGRAQVHRENPRATPEELEAAVERSRERNRELSAQILDEIRADGDFTQRFSKRAVNEDPTGASLF